MDLASSRTSGTTGDCCLAVKRLITLVIAITALSSTFALAQEANRVSLAAGAVYSSQPAQGLGMSGNNPSIPHPGVGGSAAGFQTTGIVRIRGTLGVGA